MIPFSITHLAFPAVISLIAFLAYTPQYLFRYIEPGALDQRQSWIFNLLLFCTWVCYARACFTDPGHVPRGWPANDINETLRKSGGMGIDGNNLRCIPKMDHHCPWTINCVSHRTFPHFFRFLVYAVAAMLYLEYFLSIRLAVLWNNRSLPSVHPGTQWPPPDPDRMPRQRYSLAANDDPFTNDHSSFDVDAFRERQRKDVLRFSDGGLAVTRRMRFQRGDENAEGEEEEEEEEEEGEEEEDGVSGWRDANGERLEDFGVEEEGEVVVDEDDLPLAEVLRRRKGGRKGV
ncbi:MAG: hypothetical protein Q9186_002449 [Xanthomendoza sp. 1 TL-2023]